MSLLCENCTLLVIPSALFQSIYTGGSKGRELCCITSWKNSQFDDYRNKILPLFVLSMVDPKQNAGSLLTPVSDTLFMLFHMVSAVMLVLSMVGSFNHSLIGGNSSTANQIL